MSCYFLGIPVNVTDTELSGHIRNALVLCDVQNKFKLDVSRHFSALNCNYYNWPACHVMMFLNSGYNFSCLFRFQRPVPERMEYRGDLCEGDSRWFWSNCWITSIVFFYTLRTVVLSRSRHWLIIRYSRWPITVLFVVISRTSHAAVKSTYRICNKLVPVNSILQLSLLYLRFVWKSRDSRSNPKAIY